jgi:hypothetical protein
MKTKAILLLIIGSLAVAGCQSENTTGETQGVSQLPLPKGITTRLAPSAITAEAQVLQGEKEVTRVPLQISGSTASANIKGLSPGQYSIVLKFTQTNTGLVLATARKQVEVGSQSSELGFARNDYSFPDDDSDRFSNLGEVNEETNPNDGQDKPQPARVFITSIKGKAKLSTWPDANGSTGMDAADAICQARANAAGFTTQFKAWISDANNDAACHVLGLSGKWDSVTCQTALLGDRVTGPWVRIDGEPVFPFSNPEASDAWDTMQVPICVDENGVNLCDNKIYAWTGTDSNGRYLENYGSCLGWTSSSNNETGGYGSGNNTIGNWTESWKVSCGASDSIARLYCFETTERAQALPDYKVPNSKMIFISSARDTGDLNSWPGVGDLAGVFAADAVCQRLARESSLPNPDKYKAWLSEYLHPIGPRITSNGPWSRPDGVLVAKDKAMLLSGRLHTSISLTEKGEYDWDRAWTGTLPDGSASIELSCSNWRHDSSATEFGKQGATSSAHEEWTDADHWEKVSCDQKARLICLEDE